MGRAPCCDKANVKRGPWSPEEDETLRNYVQNCGTGGNWIALPQKAGLKRCGKSCRLRWLNYLRPDIKHGGFTEEEDNIIVSLYGKIGSRWSVIAANLAGRTDNDVKNHWNTKLKKKFFGVSVNKINIKSHHHRHQIIQLSNTTTINVPTGDYNDNPTTTTTRSRSTTSSSEFHHLSSLPDYYNPTQMMSYPYLPSVPTFSSQTTPSPALLLLPSLLSPSYDPYHHQHSLLAVHHDQQEELTEANLEASGTTNLSAAGSPSSLITMERNNTTTDQYYRSLSAAVSAGDGGGGKMVAPPEDEFLLADFGFGGGFPLPYDHQQYLSFSSMIDSSYNYYYYEDARVVVDRKPTPQPVDADHHHQGLSSQSSSTSHAAAANLY